MASESSAYAFCIMANSVKVSDLRPDDKLPPVFLWDFIVYQFGYGLKAIEIYKGQKYEKTKLRSVEEFMEEE